MSTSGSDSQPVKKEDKTVNLIDVVVASTTHTGFKRTVNEDAYLNHSHEYFWLVADGMGGHSKGDKASRLIVESFSESELCNSLTDRMLLIEKQLRYVNEKLQQEQQDGGDVCGSTVVLLTFAENLACIAWVGDSRLYLYRNGLKQLTVDHSHVQHLIQRGELTKAEAEGHPLSNVITRAVGADDRLMLEWKYSSIQPGDRFLLCTDGLTKELSNEEIRLLMTTGGAKECCDALLRAVLAKGASDNVTITVVDVASAKAVCDETKLQVLNRELARFDSQLTSGRITDEQYTLLRKELFSRFRTNKTLVDTLTIPVSEQTFYHAKSNGTVWKKWLGVILMAALIIGAIYAFR